MRQLENSVAPQRQHDEKTKKSEPGSHERLERRKKTWKVAPSEPKAREKRIWRRRCTKRSKRNICSSSRAETFLNDYHTEEPCQPEWPQSNADFKNNGGM
ncbi:hypothetical protein B9Z55_025719 [Caenorhabditis nigoni]|uniref:Uncharacterized protein n=1 Tax=Caenorhabditis nigoni TaxID=1611254 RepID=A0A2G5SZL3_9PELO|nr:hypothetical protein B9Z55_025719 [Caenorhabditis nigoni]